MLHGLAIVSYPTIPPAIAVLAAPLLPWRRWRHPAFLVYPLGLFLGAGWTLIFVLRASAEQLKTAIDYTVFGGGVSRGVDLENPKPTMFGRLIELQIWPFQR